MELNKISIEFKEVRANLTNQHISADVIVIDKTTSEVQPIAYMLKNDQILEEEDFEAIKNGCLLYDRDAFILLGEVLTIDKKKKYIVMVNQNTLTYKKLIIAAGKQNALLSYEFLAGVQTLVDALRVRSKIPSSFANLLEMEQKKLPPSHVSQENKDPFPKRVETISHTNITIHHFENHNSSLTDATKRLYEVQI